MSYFIGLVLWLNAAGVPEQSEVLVARDTVVQCQEATVEALRKPERKDEIAELLESGLTPRLLCLFVPGPGTDGVKL